MKQQSPVLALFFVAIFLVGFMTLLLTQDAWKDAPDSEFPLYAKLAIFAGIGGVIGMIVEVVRYRIKYKKWR